MRPLKIAAAWCGAALAYMAAQHACGQALAWLPREALNVLALVQTNNPQIEAAYALKSAEYERAWAQDGFFDPRASAALGASRGPVAAPDSTLAPRIGGDGAGVQAGLLIPLRVGAYVGVGASQRYLFDADGFEDLGQTIAGVRLEMPLLQNRGFRTQALSQAALDAEAAVAAAQARAVEHTLLRNGVVLYANWLYAAANVRESVQACTRVERLLQETRERVELETVAEYQAFSAQMEVSFRQEELRQAHTALDQARQALETITGGLAVEAHFGGPELFGAWAERCATTDVARLLAQSEVRPEYVRSEEAIRAAEHLEAVARDALRSNLALVAGVGFQGEDDNGGFGREARLRDDTVGIEVAVVWSRPLGFTAESARARAQRAEVQAARAALRQVDLSIREERGRAEVALVAALDRRALVERAVQEAKRALGAEEQRLALGEGRSRNVLDAQKDLTTAERRANAAAFDMIVAFADLTYAVGVPFLPWEVDHVALRPPY